MAGLDDAIDKARGPKKGVTGGGVTQKPAQTPTQTSTGNNVTVSPSTPVLGGPVQRPGAVQTALQQQEAANPYPTVDPNASVGEHLLAAARQTGRGVENVGRVFADEFTHGSYDKRFAPSGPDAARASTQQASDELGTGGNLGIRTLANIANPIKKISEGAGLVRSGVEGGITGGWDAYEHGGTPYDVLIGAGTGAAAGSGLSAAGKGIYQAARKYAPTVGQNILSLADKIGFKPGGGTTSSVTQDAKDAANAAFQQLDQNNYHSPHVLNAANQIDTSVLNDPIVRTASPGTHRVLTNFQKDVTTNIANGDPTTAGNIHTQIKALDPIIAQGGTDGASALQAKTQLTGLFGNLPPTNPGVAPSNVVEQFNKANAAHAVYKNAGMLENMEDQLGTYGKMPGPTAQAEMNPKTGNPDFYKGPGQKEAMTAIGQSGDTAPSIFNIPFATGVGAGAGGYFGHPYVGATVGAIADAGRAVSAPAAARSTIYNAYPALTGVSPVNPETAVTEAMKRPGMGILSAYGGKPNPIDAVPGTLSPYIFPYMFGQ
jgi:hypothetical protein